MLLVLVVLGQALNCRVARLLQTAAADADGCEGHLLNSGGCMGCGCGQVCLCITMYASFLCTYVGQMLSRCCELVAVVMAARTRRRLAGMRMAAREVVATRVRR